MLKRFLTVAKELAGPSLIVICFGIMTGFVVYTSTDVKPAYAEISNQYRN